MIKHIVMWKLKESAFGNDKATNAKLIKEKLESLNGKIPGMITMELGINITESDAASDVVLYSEFESQPALDDYQNHADHQAIKPFVFECRSERREVDYEM
ncbi:MAG: Dabb family protein [Gammaproteobacteria bacterium]|nr:Dabb family protein [Gammaproteobacteria bacterium]